MCIFVQTFIHDVIIINRLTKLSVIVILDGRPNAPSSPNLNKMCWQFLHKALICRARQNLCNFERGFIERFIGRASLTPS